MKINPQVRTIVLSDDFNDPIMVVFSKFGWHYVMDGVGGIIIVLIGVLVARVMLTTIRFSKA
jgi:hypothetical protein